VRSVKYLVGALLASILVVPSAYAQAPPGTGADLSVKLTAPAVTPLVGQVFDLVFTVRNDGPETATQTYFSNYLSQELELKSVTPDSCTADQPVPADAKPRSQPATAASGGSASPGSGKAMAYPAGGGINCALGDMASGATATITMTLERVGARETYNSGWIGSNVDDPDYENNYTELFIDADKTKPSDIGVTLSANSKSPEVGGTFALRSTVTNNGPSIADSVTFVDSIYDGLDIVDVVAGRAGDKCEIKVYPGYTEPGTEGPSYGGYSEVICDLAPIQSGASAAVTMNVTRTTAWAVYNSAWVVSSNYDENYENDYAYIEIPADPSVTSDLSLKMHGPETTPLVGDTFDLTITVANEGPSTAGDVWVSDYLPPSLEFVSTTPADRCTFNDWGPYPLATGPETAAPAKQGDSYYPMWGNGLFCDIGSLPAGEKTTFSITVKRVTAWESWNSSWVSSSNYDPNYENNYSDMVIEPDKSHPADLSLTMTAPEKPDVGADFDFVLTATNNGPSAADGVVVSDYVPYGTEFKAVTSSDGTDACEFKDYPEWDTPMAKEGGASLRPSFYGFQEVVCDLGTMAPGESSTITITVTRTTEYEIWNSAWILGSNYDENFENDYASALVAGEPYPGACMDDGTVDGTKGSDEIVVGDCEVKTGAGADSIGVVPSSAGRSSKVTAGKGRDIISIDVALGATAQRFIDVDAGGGADTINITVAPGAGGATIVVNGADGNDHVNVSAPAGAAGLRILIKGGAGNDFFGPMGAPSGLGVPGLIMRGGAGSDLLQGGEGDDKLSGGPGGDRLYGGPGDDVMHGGHGADVCRGGPGHNTRKAC
jgi:uncharacterized repeat protein (TIGR01451 family)